MNSERFKIDLISTTFFGCLQKIVLFMDFISHLNIRLNRRLRLMLYDLVKLFEYKSMSKVLVSRKILIYPNCPVFYVDCNAKEFYVNTRRNWFI